MPLLLWEQYEDGYDVGPEVVEDGTDIVISVELLDGTRKLIIAIAPSQSTLSYVMNVDMGGNFPDPEELADACKNPDNLRAVMTAGEQHTIRLLAEVDGPSALIIQHLGSQATDDIIDTDIAA
jgi:hypothetical protein